MFGLRRFFTGAKGKQAARAAADFLTTQHQALTLAGVTARLRRLGSFTTAVSVHRPGLRTLLDPALRWDLLTDRSGAAPEILDRSAVAGLPEALHTIRRAVAAEASVRAAAQQAGEQVRQGEVQRLLAQMPLDALKSATRDRLRLGPLSQAGIRTVDEVLSRTGSLSSIPGLGDTSARHILGAAQTPRQTTHDEMPVRIDINNRRPETTLLLRRLAEWDACRQTRGAAADLERADELAPLGAVLRAGTSHLLVAPTRDLTAADLRESVGIVTRRAGMLTPTTGTGRTPRNADPWDDFLARPADHFAMLAELGFLAADERATHGDLPEEIVKAVRDQALSGEHLTASLRGYQSFAARFALVQRKVIIGDEMGLGKTVEAIAVLAHLRSRGETHFLVVCPAAVVTNWTRETTGKSTLRAHRLHGPDRARAARTWQRDGGVAVTTYETLPWFETLLPGVRNLACVVVDEAHYIKNPQAKRTTRTTGIIARTERAILLTGTPLENKVEEFRNLASYVRPDLTRDATDLSPMRFRRQIAPAYLRRNQEDVLAELPELVEVEEWLPMSGTDVDTYRDAVRAGNFMAMRQAAWRQGPQSEKARRLIDIVGEATDNGRKVLVFSYFRDVLDVVARSVPATVIGPLTGSVPANQRQRMVDEFTSTSSGVLIAQIMAGGVGLNIQAASVVILCEPQLKPTTEEQAIARAHRMGQVQTVQVHRLLSENSVDQRIVDILTRKKQLFEDYARTSVLADATPDAVDLPEAELARQVIAAERQRIFGGA